MDSVDYRMEGVVLFADCNPKGRRSRWIIPLFFAAMECGWDSWKKKKKLARIDIFPKIPKILKNRIL